MMSDLALTNGNGNRIRPWIPLLIWLLTTVVAVALAYGMVTGRVAVLEARYDSLLRDVAEIKADIKVLLRREPRTP